MSDLVEELRAASPWPGSLSDMAADEIERLREQVKLAVWSDSEECKMITAETERLAAKPTPEECRLIDKHCDWVAFGHAFNALMKRRRALEGK